MIVALALLGTAFSFRTGSGSEVSLPKTWSVITVVALMIYVSAYQVGFGPISWLMRLEAPYFTYI